MISFIIIGRNEGWKLSKCIQSIIDLIEYNTIDKFEIIYVDSGSTDNSIEKAKEFEVVRIFKLTGNFNAAIARNVGSKEAKGDVYFFIDGDMEIKPNFLKAVYTVDSGLIDNFVSGHWINYFYDHSDKLIKRENLDRPVKDIIEKVTGGLFLIKKETWDMVGGMNNKFKKSQDIDLGLRLAKRGIYLLRKKEFAAIHHTISYLNPKRMWQDFFNWNHLYGRSFLYRTHLFNRHVFERVFMHDYSAILLIISLISIVFSKVVWLSAFLLYFTVILLRGKFNLRKLVFYFLRDLSVLVGFFIFFPKEPQFSYEKIKLSEKV